MTTSPHVPDDDAPASTAEDYDEAGRYVGPDLERADDDRAAGDDRIGSTDADEDDEGLEEEPPAIQPRSS